MADRMYFARRPFTYDVTDLDVGQAIELTGQKNDEKLIRLGLLREMSRAERSALAQCGRCGAKFVAEGFLNQHGTKRHPRHGRDELAELERAESESRILEATMPLEMDRTAATRDGRRAARG